MHTCLGRGNFRAAFLLALLVGKRLLHGFGCRIVALCHKFFHIQLISGLHEALTPGELGKRLQRLGYRCQSPLGSRPLRVTCNALQLLLPAVGLAHLHASQAHQTSDQRIGLLLGCKHGQLSHCAY